VVIEGLNGSPIFRLTRVTRIFQKKIFSETTPGARAGCRAGFFVARAARAAARGGFLVFCIKNQENTEEIKAMPFQKGQSGNPAGRPRGIVNRATALAQNLLSERAEGIARKVIELAEEGDMAAIRVCMERLVPPIKHQPVAVELPPIEKPADSVEALASIAAAVAAGDLTAAEAAELAKVVDVYVRALDSKGFDERLSALEKGINGTPDVPGPAAVRDDTRV
jgi:Family of unknown function (DUF5681)